MHVLIPSALLCIIHCKLGLLDQHTRVGAIAKKRHNPCRKCLVNFHVKYIPWLMHTRAKRLQLGLHIHRIRAAQQYGKFVPAKAEQHIRFRKHLCKMLHKLHKQLVAAVVAVTVVDHLEIVDINQYDKPADARFPGIGNDFLHILFKMIPAGKACQVVEICGFPQAVVAHGKFSHIILYVLHIPLTQ